MHVHGCRAPVLHTNALAPPCQHPRYCSCWRAVVHRHRAAQPGRGGQQLLAAGCFQLLHAYRRLPSAHYYHSTPHTARPCPCAPQLLQGGEAHHVPLWKRSDLSPEQLITEFRRECRVVRKAMEGDLVKVGVCRGRGHACVGGC